MKANRYRKDQMFPLLEEAQVVTEHYMLGFAIELLHKYGTHWEIREVATPAGRTGKFYNLFREPMKPGEQHNSPTRGKPVKSMVEA